jgi:hypothetical protein
VPNPDGLISADPAFDFTRLGPRTPALLISPWLPRLVDSTVYEHSSLLATVKKLFHLPNFLTERDRAANSFEHLFEQARFRHDTPERLVPLPVPKVAPDTHMGRLLDSVQKEVMQGVVNHLPPGEEQGLATDQLAANTMTLQQASTLTRCAMDHFKACVAANGGLHPDASENLRILGRRKTPISEEREPDGRTRTSTAGPAPENGTQTVGAGSSDQKP